MRSFTITDLHQHLTNDLMRIRHQAKLDLDSQIDIEIIYQKINNSLRALIKNMIDSYVAQNPAQQPNYNILLLGSYSGADATPWSDVEMVILYDEKVEGARDYLIKLSQWLACEFLAFNEPSGLRLDKVKNPLGISGNGTHIYTPAMLAARQTKPYYQHEPDYHLSGSLLFVDSLCGNPHLFADYKKKLSVILNKPAWYNSNITRGIEFAGYQFLRARAHPISIDKQVDVKELYRVLQYLLSSLCLYYGYDTCGLRNQLHTLTTNSLLPIHLSIEISNTINYLLQLRLRVYIYFQKQYHLINREEKDFPLDIKQLNHLVQTIKRLEKYVESVFNHFNSANELHKRLSMIPNVDTALITLLDKLPFDSRSGDALAQHAKILPNALSVLEYAEYLKLNPVAMMDGLTRVAHKFMQLEEHQKAENIMNRVDGHLESYQAILPLNLLANIYRYEGRLGLLTYTNIDKSLQWFQKSISLWRRIIENSRIPANDTIVHWQLAQSDMAKLLIETGELDKAKDLFTRMYPTANRFQQYNCDTYLGRIYFLQGNDAEAEKYFMKASRILDELNTLQRKQKMNLLRNVDVYLFYAELLLLQNRHGEMTNALNKVRQIYCLTTQHLNPYASANIQRWFLLAKSSEKLKDAKERATHSYAMAGTIYRMFPAHRQLKKIESFTETLKINSCKNTSLISPPIRSKL